MRSTFNQLLQSVLMTLRQRTWYWNLYFCRRTDISLVYMGLPHRRHMRLSWRPTQPLTIEIRLYYLDTVWRVRKPNAKQNRFQLVTFFFTFFFSIFLRHYVTYVPAGFSKVLLALILGCHGRIQRGGRGYGPPPPEKSQKIGFVSDTGSDLLKNHKATKPAFNVGPLSWHQYVFCNILAISVTIATTFFMRQPNRNDLHNWINTTYSTYKVSLRQVMKFLSYLRIYVFATL